MQKRILAVTLNMAFLGWATTAMPTLAADHERPYAGASAGSSMDAIWSDPGVSGKKTLPPNDSSQAATSSQSTSSPLCSLEVLRQSELIKSGGWPGIGPFKGLGREFVDPGENKLKVEAEKNKVTSAELTLNSLSKNFLNLEMTADFLLESLGAKPARIADFNGQLEKSKAKILGPLNLSAGTYLVYMHPEPPNPSPGEKVSFIIKVSAKDVSPDLLKEHGSSASTTSENGLTDDATLSKIASTESISNHSPTSQQEERTSPESTSAKKETALSVEDEGSSAPLSNNAPQMTSTALSTSKATNFDIVVPKTAKAMPKIAAVENTAVKPSPKADDSSQIATATTINTIPANTAPVNTVSAPAATDVQVQAPRPLKETFAEVINNWQKIKKVAVRQRQISDLSQVLAGHALARQSDAIKWLTTNKKYYEMEPREVIIDHYIELVKGQKYAVYAQVRESSKFFDEATTKVLKDSEDTYNVNYTIEKVGDSWFISDSAIVNQANKTTASKTNNK